MIDMEDAAELLVPTIAVIAAVAIITGLYTFLIWWSWNLCMPHIFNLPQITLWQGFGLSVLYSCLTFRPSTKDNKK